MNLKKKSKTFSFFIKSLTFISLFSIGFSSFNLADNAPVSGNLTLNDGKVLEANEYISNFSIRNFEYNKSGIINNDIVSSKGTLSISFNLNMRDGKNNYFFDNYNNDFIGLNVQITETNKTATTESFSLLSYISKTNPISCRLRLSNETTTTSVQIPDFTNEAGVLSFKYQYNFDDFSQIDFIFFNFLIDFDFVDVISTFETSVYNFLKSSDFSLNYSISF